MAPEFLSFTGLPNLHPAVVHFPLALAPVAALFDIARLTVARNRRWLDPAAKWLWILAAIGAAAARWSGEHAAEAAGVLEVEAEKVLCAHADQALVATILIVTVAMARVVLSGWESARERPLVVWGSVLIAFEVAALGALGFTADLGGRLVYDFGVAVAKRPPPVIQPLQDAPPVEPVEAVGVTSPGLPVLGDDGSLRWRPLGQDSVGGGIRVESISGPQALRPAATTGVLELLVDGSGSLVLPGTYGDLRFELDADLGDFEGTLALEHHRGNAADRLEVTRTADSAWLELRRGDRRLDRSEIEVGAAPISLVVTSVGRHQRGFVNGVAVAHGHIPSLEEGGAALAIDGRGTIRVRSIEIRPTKESP